MPKLKNNGVYIASLILLGAIALLLLTVQYGNYLRKIEGLTLFLPTSSYFADCLRVPGGLVTWLSTYLTQSLYHPWLGATIYVVLLVAVQCATVKALDVRGPWRMAVVVVPVLILMALTRLGYLIYTLRPAGYAYQLVVGMLIVALALWAYRSIKPWWGRGLAALVVVTIGYHYLGYYALATGVIMAVMSVSSRGRLWYVPALVALTGVAVVPPLWFGLIGGYLMPGQMYVSPLPQFYANEPWQWALYLSPTVAILIICVLRHAKLSLRRPWPMRIALSIWVVAVACIKICSYDDRNFLTTLDLDRAIWAQDWPRALEIAESLPAESTRLNTVLAHIALLRSGVAADRLFAINYGWAPYNTSRGARPIHDAAGALISYHLGLINYAYRWGMEYIIAQGMGVERLKILAKCAILNYELPLAKTYLEILYNTPWHRAWAKKYLRMVANPFEINNDTELMAIKQLMCHPNEFVNDHGAFESYIWPLLATEDPGTPEYNDLSMQAALVDRDLDAFIAKLPEYASRTPRLPRYYQEAALLWSLLSKQPLPVAIDKAVEGRHGQFQGLFRNTSTMVAEEQRKVMREAFSDTYWYYYIFTEDQQSI